MGFPFPSDGFQSVVDPADRRRDTLVSMLISLGAGMSQAGSQGRGPLDGIAPGAAMFMQSQGQQQQHDEAAAMRNWQMGLHVQALKDKEDERKRLLGGAAAWADQNDPNKVPGMRAAPPPLMGGAAVTGGGPPPTDLAPNPNNIGNVRPVGSSTGFQKPASFEDGVALAVNNAKAYPAAFNNGQPMTLHQIGERWAPKGDGANDPAQWARNVGSIGGLDPTKPIDLNDPQTAAAFARGVHGAEKGAGYARPAADYLPAITRVSGGAQPVEMRAPPAAPPDVPRPTLPPDTAAYLANAVRAGALTPQAAETEKNRLITEEWAARRDQASKAWTQQHETYRFNRSQGAEKERFDRGQNTEGQFVRRANGTQEWVPKSQMNAGTQNFDKPPEPGTVTGDIAVINKALTDQGFANTPEYAAAHARAKGHLIDGPNGLKYAPNMDTYPAPTFRQGGVSAPQPTTPSRSADASGLVPIGDKNYTETQNKDHTYAMRLANAIPQLEEMLKDGDKYSTAKLPSSYERAKMNSAYVPDTWVSPNAKAFRRVTSDIVTALLRRESGANIPMSEYPAEFAKFIPQAGDTDAELRAKMKALKIAAKTFTEATGRPASVYGNVFDHEEAPTAKAADAPRVRSYDPATGTLK